MIFDNRQEEIIGESLLFLPTTNANAKGQEAKKSHKPRQYHTNPDPNNRGPERRAFFAKGKKPEEQGARTQNYS